MHWTNLALPKALDQLAPPKALVQLGPTKGTETYLSTGPTTPYQMHRTNKPSQARRAGGDKPDKSFEKYAHVFFTTEKMLMPPAKDHWAASDLTTVNTKEWP